MDITYIIILALCLILILCVVLYLIFMVPVVTSGNIKYVDCPDFWVNTSKITDSSDNIVDVSAGCYVTNTSSWHNIGKCIPYESGGVSYLDYCVHDSNAHTLTNSQYANNLANNYYIFSGF